MNDKVIHFGEFVRWNRVNARMTTEAFGREIGLTARRVIAIEKMATPEVQHTTLVALARVLGVDAQELERVWRTTPVPVTKRRKGPVNDEAARFSVACSASGISTAEGMRRLRAWIVAQSEETQRRVLGRGESAGGGQRAAGSKRRGAGGE